MLDRFAGVDRFRSLDAQREAYIRRHAGEGRAEHIEGSARRAGRAGSQLLRVDLVEFGVVEQQAAPLRQASDVAIVVLPADVVS
jgi:hypothetical protein